MSPNPKPTLTVIYGRAHRQPHDPTRRGYVVQYRPDEVNHCPGCGRSHWHVGRMSAECAFCGTALPLPDTSTGAGVFFKRG